MASSCLVYNQSLKCESIHKNAHTLVVAKKLDVLKIAFFNMLFYVSRKNSLPSVWCNIWITLKGCDDQKLSCLFGCTFQEKQKELQIRLIYNTPLPTHTHTQCRTTLKCKDCYWMLRIFGEIKKFWITNWKWKGRLKRKVDNLLDSRNTCWDFVHYLLSSRLLSKFLLFKYTKHKLFLLLCRGVKHSLFLKEEHRAVFENKASERTWEGK